MVVRVSFVWQKLSSRFFPLTRKPCYGWVRLRWWPRCCPVVSQSEKQLEQIQLEQKQLEQKCLEQNQLEKKQVEQNQLEQQQLEQKQLEQQQLEQNS